MTTRHILTVSLSILFAASTGAQEAKPETKEPRTKLEAFQAKTGSVLIKGIAEVGHVSGTGKVTIGCREFTDAGSGNKAYGIVIQVNGGAKFDRESKTYIDYDEIDSLLKGIDYITKLDKTVTGLPSFEAEYKTKGELTVTTFSSNSTGDIQAAVQSGRFGSATAFLTLKQLGYFKEFIEEAKKKLDSIKKDK